ncbi:helix-turn-helix domain-containing protein [Agromyces bauzanensis]
MPTSTEHWRARAGLTASKGVLAPAPGEPGIAPLAAAAHVQAASDDAPVRLSRYAVDGSVAHLVRHVWIPRWRLPPGVVVRQGVLEYPSANLVIEAGAAAVHGPALGRGDERLDGSGWAFGALLQPGVARRLVRIPMRALVGGSVPVDGLRVRDAHVLVGDVRRAMAAGDEASALAAFEDWMRAQHLELDADAALVRDVVELAETDRSILRADDLARASGLGLRTLQRLLRDELGLTPKWLIRRYRLQEAAAALAESDPRSLADLAARLGYADQAHLSREFRAVIGETPRRYAGAARAQGVPDPRAPS